MESPSDSLGLSELFLQPDSVGMQVFTGLPESLGIPFVSFGAAKYGASATDAMVDATKGTEAAVGATKSTRYFESFNAFKSAMGSAGEGMQWHHIVEQSQVGRFGTHAIQNADNIVAVSNATHLRLNSLYSSIRKSITGSETLTVRQWLETKSYDEALEFGKKAIENTSSGVW